METMIEVRGLSKQFGSLTAVEDVSFSVKRGEVLGFLGPNGAGKSTTMKMITGFLAPSAGTVSVCAHDVLTDPLLVKKSIGYLPEGAPAYSDMTPHSFLHFIAEIRGFRGDEKDRRVDSAIKKVHLESVLFKPIDTLSKGFKRRVGLAQAILHDPQVLVMDEPTDGLDPNQKYEVRMLIKEMSKDKAIIVSTHILEEVQAVCTRAIIIAQGKLLFDGTPAELEEKSRFHNAVTLSVVTDSAQDIEKQLKTMPGVKSVEMRSQEGGMANFVVFPTEKKPIIKELGHLLREKNWEIDELSVETGHLDEVFREITTGSDVPPEGLLT
jgi:ABC-2 type transport system ATP-binding protein